MVMTDPLGDMLTRIRNGQRAGLPVVRSPASKFRSSVLEVLTKEGYIRGYSQQEVTPASRRSRSSSNTTRANR